MEHTTFILSIFLLIGILLFGCTQQTEKSHQSALNFNLYSIHEINQNNFTSGSFNVEGYIVKIYTCPQCPQDAQCKPCMRDNIVISESINPLDTYSLTKNELVVFTNDSKQFELGGKYTFSIIISDNNTTGDLTNDIELVGYDPIK